MSSVKANWHLDALVLPDDDPMQGDIAVFGRPIDLGKSKAELREALQNTVRKEARYDRNGLTCDLKWTAPGPDGTPDQRNPCYVCPHYREDVTDDNHLALLCSVGREQNDLLDMLDAVVSNERALDSELIAAWGREQAEIEELVQAAA